MKTRLSVAILALSFSAFAFYTQARAPSSTSWSSARPIEVVLSSYRFTPKNLTLHHGQAYRLHFVNDSSRGHNSSAPAFFAAARIDPADASAIKNGKVELADGEARDVRLVPLAAGAYNATCTRFLHSAHG